MSGEDIDARGFSIESSVLTVLYHRGNTTLKDIAASTSISEGKALLVLNRLHHKYNVLLEIDKKTRMYKITSWGTLDKQNFSIPRVGG